jgi:hypothetical protein
MDSLPVMLANYAGGEGAQPLSTVKDYQAYLSRLNQLGPWIDQAIANMREGMRRGVVQPKAVMVSALPQFKQLVAATPEDSIYYTPAKKLPAVLRRRQEEADSRLPRHHRRQAESGAGAPGGLPGKGIHPGLPHQHRPERPAERHGLVPGARGEPDHDRFAAGADPPDRPEGSGAHPGRVRAHRPADGLHRPGRRPADLGAGAAEVQAFQDRQEVIAVYRKLDAQLKTKLPALFTLRPKTPLDLRLEPELSRATASDHYTRRRWTARVRACSGRS